jgi:hypothetical protein
MHETVFSQIDVAMAAYINCFTRKCLRAYQAYAAYAEKWHTVRSRIGSEYLTYRHN